MGDKPKAEKSDELWEELKKLARSKRKKKVYSGPKAPQLEPRKKRRSPNEVCRGKYIFESKGHARRFLKAQNRRGTTYGGFRARVYRCNPCDGWHIANRDKDLN